MSFFREIRQRKVVQVGAVYAAVAWLVAQVAALLEDALALPDPVDAIVIVVLALGFPVAVVFAWIFDLTPEGIRRTDTAGPKTAGTVSRPLYPIAMTALVAGALGAGGAWLWIRDPGRDWVLSEAVPAIERHIAGGDWESAFRVAREAKAVAPDEPALLELTPRYAWTGSITSEPEGATVYRRPYDSAPEAWETLGATPLEDIEIPFGLTRLRLEREGYLPLDRTVGGGGAVVTELPVGEAYDKQFTIGTDPYQLDTPETLDEDKVRVTAWTEANVLGESAAFGDFFLRRHEVTNAEFKEFVDAGGYRQPNLWRVPFVLDGEEIGLDDAMARFVDRTGRRGPSTWAAGDYPEGEGDYPVAGVSWYEASAYARFRGEELPTLYHWQRAIAPGAFPWTLPASNLDGDALRPVGEGDAMSWVGAFDLLGNVREWLVNARGEDRAVIGGSVNDDLYLAMQTNLAISPFDRSEFNGFRTMRTADDAGVMARARAPLPVPDEVPPPPEAVSDEIYAAYSRVFAYNPSPLEPVVEPSQTTRSWVRERISFNAAYGDERMVLYLYMPANASPPYQTVLYWPGSAAFSLRSIDDYAMHLDFIVKSGRAVAFPVYKGTFERGDGSPAPEFWMPEFRESLIQGVKDLRRSMDYLETRVDIDGEAIAFYGHSWGSVAGASALAQEPRFSAAVIYVGFPLPLDPEVHPLQALPRVGIPVLMLSGEYDPIVSLPTAERYFSRIGTPEPLKRHVVAPGGHFVPRDLLIRETLSWLDEHLGPVPRF